VTFAMPVKNSLRKGLAALMEGRKGMLQRIPPHLPAVIMLGTVSQIGQVIFLRELLMVFHGNELSIGLILAAWLVWIGLGSGLGAALVNRVNRPLLLFLLSTAGLVLTLPASIFFMRGLRSLFDVVPGAYLSLPDMILSCFLLLAPACLLLGLQFVLLSRLWRENSQAQDTSGADKTYISEAAGNMLGGILFTLLMVHYLNSFQSALLAGISMLIAVLLLIRKSTPGSEKLSPALRLLPAGLLVLAALAFPFLDYVDEHAYKMQWKHFAPQHQLLETHQSIHGTISVAQRQDQYSFFQSGHLIFSTAGPMSKIPGLEEQEAVDFAHLAMVQHNNPQQILLIGGGLRGTLGEILKHPVEQVDYIELDPVLTEAARPYVSRETRQALSDPRVRLIHTDGRLFVKTARKTYDLIIVDHPDPLTAELNRYYTENFFREAQSLLHQDGVLVTGTTSSPDLRGTALANRNTTIYHTLGLVFDQVLPAGERFMFYFASDAPGQVTVKASTLLERYLDRNIDLQGFSPQRFHTLLEQSQLQRVNWVVRHHGRSPEAHLHGPGAVPPFPSDIAKQEAAESQLPPVQERYFINTDFKPIGYFYTLMFWEDLTREEHPFSLQQLLLIQPWWVLPLASLPLLAVLGLRRFAATVNSNRPDLHFAVLFTVFTTGLSTMALQVALLFSFQSIYGFVYEIVGLITAMFMCGLALGAFLTHRYIKEKTRIRTLAKVQLIMALLAIFIALGLPQAAAVQSPVVVFILFSTLTFVAGLLNGIDFPLAAACYMDLKKQAETTAGTVYGMELFGACLGAVLASAFVAPVLGIIACCLLAALASGLASVILLISGKP